MNKRAHRDKENKQILATGRAVCSKEHMSKGKRMRVTKDTVTQQVRFVEQWWGDATLGVGKICFRTGGMALLEISSHTLHRTLIPGFCT